VPFRGRVLCTSCASKALGTPEPVERSVPRTSPGIGVVVGGLLGIALIATVPPWHRSGTLTGTFAAWRPSGEMPVLLAVLSIVAAAVSLFVGAAIRRRLTGTVLIAVAGLALVAAGSTAFSVLRAPDFYAFTPAPFITLAASTAAVLAAAVGLARWGPGAARAAP
jgi:hypothetical protein